MKFLPILSAVLAIATTIAGVYGAPVDLGLADPYAILAGTTVTSGGTVGTVVNGDIGIFPGSGITGFPPGIRNGELNTGNGAAAGAQGALTAAYNFVATQAINATLTNQDLGGMTLLPGVYKFGVAAAMNGMLTLDAVGNPNAVWMFQIGSALLIAEGSSIIFKDSIGNPDYVYWQVGSTATLETGVSMIGNILAHTAINLNIGATVTGRCLASNAEVTLHRNPITIPPKIPTSIPTAAPSQMPSATPSAMPSKAPSAVPTTNPSASPSAVPSLAPSAVPTRVPSVVPSANPSASPSAAPSVNPSKAPSAIPTVTPSVVPTVVPTQVPSVSPTVTESAVPTVADAPSPPPTLSPSVAPSTTLTMNPSAVPTTTPSESPSANPSAAPSTVPSANPSVAPSTQPSEMPSMNPSVNPSAAPSVVPSASPSASPSVNPSAAPSTQPSEVPSVNPTLVPPVTPTVTPSQHPSAQPSMGPSAIPSVSPTVTETVGPTFVNQPTAPPSWSPSGSPSAVPSVSATSVQPSASPSVGPSVTISAAPTLMELPIDLGLAGPYAILAGSTVTSTGVVGTVVNGNIGIFPGSAITGFPPAVLNGAVDTANGASGGAQGALTSAYNAIATRRFNTTLSNQDLGGMTLFPGVYKFDGAATMNGMLTLDARGDPAAVWMFQIGSSLLVTEGSSVIFKDSLGNPDLVYWQVGSSATLAIGVPMVGNILALASITVNNGATVSGRCLARNGAVTLDNSVITKPTVVAFAATQTVSGLSLEQFLANATVNTAVLKSAICASMPGVLPADVKNFTVSAGPSSASRSLFLRSSVARALAADSIILKYNVFVFSTKTAAQLQSELKTAVSDGSFNNYMQAAATEQGATSLQSATSDAIETETIDPSATPASNDSNNGLTENDKMGISIGVVLGVAVLAFILLWWYGCFASTMSTSESATKESVSTTELANPSAAGAPSTKLDY